MRINLLRFSLIIALITCGAVFVPSFASAQVSFQPAEPEKREMIDRQAVRLRSLDKTTARTITFEADVGSTLKFGPIYIKVQACRQSTPLDEPESAAFLQVWEVTPEDKAEWIFSGWMFASSPGLSSMDHPIYDVWVLDCLGDDGVASDSTPSVQAEASDGELKEGEGLVDEEAVPATPDSGL